MKASIISLFAIAATASATKVISTRYETEVYTITSCEPTVTDCAATATSTVHTYTSECDEDDYPTPTPVYSTSTEAEYEVSTVYETKEYTITSCAPTVTNCPVGHVTHTVLTSTTLCPVSDKHYPTSTYAAVPTASTSVYTHYPAPTSTWISSYAPLPTHSLSTVTISTCVPSYITKVITVSASPTVVGYPQGTAAPTGVNTYAPVNTTIPFTGAANAQKAGGLLMAVGLVAALL